MRAISYTQARASLAKTIDEVIDDHTPVVITRKGEGAVVLVSLADYQALDETAYLLRSPANARRLRASVAELERGGGRVRALAEE